MTSAIVVIPARINSTRLPRKLLLCGSGKPLVVHAIEQARKCRYVNRVVVATDSDEIADAVGRHGGASVMTGQCRNGTERVAEAVLTLDVAYDVVVNLQAEYAEIEPEQIDEVIHAVEDSPECHVATLQAPIRTSAELTCTSTVKVVANIYNEAMYFSRAVIPHGKHWERSRLSEMPPLFWRHVGVYGFSLEVLQSLAAIKPCAIEEAEELEQLRWLHAGFRIKMVTFMESARGIDTPGDYDAFVQRQRGKRCDEL